MEEYFAKLREYLSMDTEITYDEFNDYYQNLLKFLQEKFENLEKEEYLKGRYIMKILSMNAGERSKRKNSQAKKYKKIWEKSEFWADAFNYRLRSMGMSQDEIDSSHEAYNQDI